MRNGSFKTMLARKLSCVAIMGEKRVQELKFYGITQTSVLEDVFHKIEFLPTLVDDVLPVRAYNKKKAAADIFDKIVREADMERNTGGVIITAEKLPDDLLASACDRIWQVNMPDVSNDKAMWFQTISDLSIAELTRVYVEYIVALLSNIDSVRRDIHHVLNELSLPPQLIGKTRIEDHYKYLILIEHLYNTYLLKLNNDGIAQSKILLHNATLQQERTIRIDKESQTLDYVYFTYKALLSKESMLKPVCNRDKYIEMVNSNAGVTGKPFFSQGEYIYVLPEILSDELFRLTGRPVQRKAFVNALERNGILVSTEGNSKTVTMKGASRHYKLYKETLIKYGENSTRIVY